MDRKSRQMRTIESHFETRADGEDLLIEGYFAVFNSDYEIWTGMTESIAPGAFKNTLGGDVRALINHDTTLVIGRTKAGTLELREDDHGLWGSIRINPKDQDALNIHARVERGDVDQCSFGFEIVDEEAVYRDDGTSHWTIREVNLFEVSCCTFPAYEETSISARMKQVEEAAKRKHEVWKVSTLSRLKGEKKNET